ncbi:MAG: hypothetical protein HZT43_12510 [Exiguobacterium profundum]|nr:MAG: hypothetical protein HZT43_12510 [Exiguobacterium profundum]
MPTYSGNGSNNTLNGSSGNDTFYGGNGDDTINAYGGNDAVYAGSDDDSVNVATAPIPSMAATTATR